MGAPQLSQPQGRLARNGLQTWLPALLAGAGLASREVVRIWKRNGVGQKQQLRGKGESLCFSDSVGVPQSL